MPIQLQFRRGNTIQNSNFVGAQGEITIDTTKKTVVIHDGTTTGGFPLVTAADFTTGNVAEANNLYFTNARVRAALSSGTGVNLNQSTGSISISQNVDTTSNVTFQNLLVTGNLTVTGNTVSLNVVTLTIEDNMIYLNSNSEITNPDLGFAGNYNDGSYKHAGLFRDATDGVWKFFENYSPEPDASPYIDTGHASFKFSNVQVTNLIGNVSGIVTSLANHTTSNLSEGSNLYFNNTRAIGALTGGSGVSIAANGRITAAETFTGTITSVAGINSGAVSNTQIYAAAANGGTISTLTTGKSIAMALVFGG